MDTTLTSTDQIADGIVAVTRQFWATPDGPRAQYTLAVPRPVDGAPRATEHTCHPGPGPVLRELGAARIRATRLRQHARVEAIEAIDAAVAAIGGYLAERERLAEDLARWAGAEAEAAHDAWVAAHAEGRHYTRCCEQAREDGARDEHELAMRLPLDQLRDRHARGLEERAVARARNAGLFDRPKI